MVPTGAPGRPRCLSGWPNPWHAAGSHSSAPCALRCPLSLHAQRGSCHGVCESFGDTGLKPEVLRGIRAQGFEEPSDVQQRAIILLITSWRRAAFPVLMIGPVGRHQPALRAGRRGRVLHQQGGRAHVHAADAAIFLGGQQPGRVAERHVHHRHGHAARPHPRAGGRLLQRHGDRGGEHRAPARRQRPAARARGQRERRWCHGALDRRDGLFTKKSGNIFRVGIFLDFVYLTTRTPHGAYVRRARRNRIDPHGGGIERIGRRTFTSDAWNSAPATIRA